MKTRAYVFTWLMVISIFFVLSHFKIFSSIDHFSLVSEMMPIVNKAAIYTSNNEVGYWFSNMLVYSVIAATVLTTLRIRIIGHFHEIKITTSFFSSITIVLFCVLAVWFFLSGIYISSDSSSKLHRIIFNDTFVSAWAGAIFVFLIFFLENSLVFFLVCFSKLLGAK